MINIFLNLYERQTFDKIRHITYKIINISKTCALFAKNDLTIFALDGIIKYIGCA